MELKWLVIGFKFSLDLSLDLEPAAQTLRVRVKIHINAEFYGLPMFLKCKLENSDVDLEQRSLIVNDGRKTEMYSHHL